MEFFTKFENPILKIINMELTIAGLFMRKSRKEEPTIPDFKSFYAYLFKTAQLLWHRGR